MPVAYILVADTPANTATVMEKKELRKLIAERKNEASPAARLDLSGPILRRLAVHPRFIAAQTVLLYHSLPDEVDTRDFVRFWSLRKHILPNCLSVIIISVALLFFLGRNLSVLERVVDPRFCEELLGIVGNAVLKAMRLSERGVE